MFFYSLFLVHQILSFYFVCLFKLTPMEIRLIYYYNFLYLINIYVVEKVRELPLPLRQLIFQQTASKASRCCTETKRVGR
jgi:hypothetical protein